MTFALARSLLLADAVTPEALAQALLVSATRGTSLVRALLATRAIDAPRLELQLERGDAPTMRHVTPVMALVQQLPAGLCERLLALPVRRDPRTGTIDVAVVDARDPHPVEEIAHWLRAPVRMVRTSLAGMDAALRRIHEKPAEAGPRALAAPIWVPPAKDRPRDLTKTPAYGSPAVSAALTGLPGLPGLPARPPAAAAAASDEPGDDDGVSPTEVMDFGTADPNIPFVLTRRSLAPLMLVDPGPPAVERGAPDEPVHELRQRTSRAEPEAVLDLRRRKSVVPGAPSAPYPPLGPELAAIRAATDRDVLLDHVVSGACTVARKVAVLAVRKEGLIGWACSPALGDPAALRAARISPAPSDALRKALDSDVAILARIPKDGTHAPLLSAMHAPPSGEVALVALRAFGKAVALVLADQMSDPRVVTERLEEIALVAGEALERLLRERRK